MYSSPWVSFKSLLPVHYVIDYYSSFGDGPFSLPSSEAHLNHYPDDKYVYPVWLSHKIMYSHYLDELCKGDNRPLWFKQIYRIRFKDRLLLSDFFSREVRFKSREVSLSSDVLSVRLVFLLGPNLGLWLIIFTI